MADDPLSTYNKKKWSYNIQERLKINLKFNNLKRTIQKFNNSKRTNNIKEHTEYREIKGELLKYLIK